MGDAQDLEFLSAFTSQPGTDEWNHVPVLLDEVLQVLQPVSGGRYVDGTVGGGGHAAAILTASAPEGTLLGLDRDPGALRRARERLAPFGQRALLVHASYERVTAECTTRGFAPLDGVLLDLGLSSLQLADPDRGFAFSKEGALDMRFDPTASGATAADLVNELAPEELARILYQYGEEKQSRRVAQAIAAARPLHTTAELANVVERSLARSARGGRHGGPGRGGHIHPATRTFQALRIAVNDELGALERVLPQIVALLAPGGRLAVIAFHSLEDRIVKQFLRRESQDCVCPAEVPICTCGHRASLRLLTHGPLRPTQAETAENPRARSARLRAAERLADPGEVA